MRVCRQRTQKRTRYERGPRPYASEMPRQRVAAWFADRVVRPAQRREPEAGRKPPRRTHTVIVVRAWLSGKSHARPQTEFRLAGNLKRPFMLRFG